MRNQRKVFTLAGLIVLAGCVAPALADEVVAPWGTIHGNLSGTAAVDKTTYPEYEFTFTAGVQPSFELDVKAAPLHADLPESRSAITFDEEGNLYWKCQWPEPKVLSVTPDGQPRWTANTDGVALGDDNRHYVGVDVDDRDSAAPVVGDGGPSGRVYAIGEDNQGNGIAVAYLKSNGMKVWETVLPYSWFAGQHKKLTPVLYGGRLYVVGAPSAGQCMVYEIDSATGTLNWSNYVGTTNAIPEATGGQMAFVPDAFAPGEHGLYFHVGGPDLAYGIKIKPGIGASDAWVASTGHTQKRSHVIYSQTTGLLYIATWADTGSTFYVYDPVTGAKSSLLAPGTGHGFYDVAMLDFNGTDVLAGGFGGTIQRYMDPNDGTGDCTVGSYYTTEWFGEPRSVGGLYQDAAGKSIYLSGTNSRTDLDPTFTSRVIAVNVTDGILVESCEEADDGPIYIDNLVISTNGVSSDPLTVALDVGGFEGYALGSIVFQVNSAQGGWGTRDATWREVGNVPGVLDIIEDPTGAGKGRVLSMDISGSCDQGVTAVWAEFDRILNPGGLANSNGTIIIEFDQYRTDLGDAIWMSHSGDYGQWWAYQPAQGGKITTKHWGPQGVSIVAGEWQHITYTFDLENNTITVSNGVETSDPVYLDYHAQDGVFDGFEFEIQDSPAVGNPALNTPTLFEYNTGPANDNNHGTNLLCGPVLGPIQEDGIQRAYFFNWQEPHKLAAVEANVPPQIVSFKSTAEHGTPIVTVDIPMDQQINLGEGDAIFSSGDAFITFEPANPPDEPEGFTRYHLNKGWYYGPYIDFVLSGDGPIDITKTNLTFEFDARAFQDPITNTNPYGDCNIFVTMYNYDGSMLNGYREYGIVYGPNVNSFPFGDWYPTWSHVTISVATSGKDTNYGGNTFDPTNITRMRFYGTDWDTGNGGLDDFIDIKNVQFVLNPVVGEIPLDATATGAAATSEPRDLSETRLVIEFTEDVSAPAGAVIITGPGGPYTPTLSADGRFVTATVSPALGEGTYVATVTGVVDLAGSGVVGDNDVEFVVKVGDADGDHDVDLRDFAVYQACIGPFDGGTCVRADFLPSLDIDADDLPTFVTGLEASGPQ